MTTKWEREKEYQKVMLTGPQKAAAFMLALSESQITKIFERLDENEIKELSQAMALLGKVPSNFLEAILIDFAQEFNQVGSVVGSYDNTERLLSKVLPKDKVEAIMEEIRGPAGKTMWDKLGNVNEEILANFLKNEHPQTIALVLTKIKSEHSSKVLSLLPESVAMDVVLRILKMESVQKQVLDDVENSLRVEFMNNLSRSSRRDNHELLAEMFNFFDRQTETTFIAALEEKAPESAEKVKSLMFTFEDLIKIDNQGIQGLLRLIDKSKLALALKGTTEAIKELFFKNMSERAVKILKEEIEALGMVRVKDVDEAQSYIVVTAKEAANRGEITIQKNQEDDQLIG